LKNKKKIPKFTQPGSTQGKGKKAQKEKEKEKSSMCPHLTTLMDNMDIVREAIPFFTEEDLPQDYLESVDPTNDDPCPDFTENYEVQFNVKTGLWESKSLSDTSCTDMFDDNLVEKTGERVSCIQPTNFLAGMYQGPDLFPTPTVDNIPSTKCACDQDWEPVQKFLTKVYSRLVSAIDICMCMQSLYVNRNRYIMSRIAIGNNYVIFLTGSSVLSCVPPPLQKRHLSEHSLHWRK
jgi:hypothetical protein